MDKPEKRIDLNSELGMSRRDLIRRGAIVGGTLMWVAPAIQSMAPNAFAAETNPGSVLCDGCIQGRTGGSVGHFLINPTPACCDCISNKGGGFVGLFACAIGANPSCVVLSGPTPGPCP